MRRVLAGLAVTGLAVVATIGATTPAQAATNTTCFGGGDVCITTYYDERTLSDGRVQKKTYKFFVGRTSYGADHIRDVAYSTAGRSYGFKRLDIGDYVPLDGASWGRNADTISMTIVRPLLDARISGANLPRP